MKGSLNTAMAHAFARIGLQAAPAHDIAPAPAAETAPCCQYCGEAAKLVTGKEIYPKYANLHDKKFWSCTKCKAYVGCHEAGKGYGDGTRPLGILANAELRAAKQAVHSSFDMLWQDGEMTRRQAYSWLAGKLQIPVENCHIGMFTVEQCERAEEFCDEYLAHF
jgi:zinc-finger-containing domain